MKLPRPLSHSSISMFLECPQKWKFKYVDGLPEKPRYFFAFGQSVHKALEYFYGVQTLDPPSLKDVLGFYERHWVKEGYRDAKQEAEYLAEGRRILTDFLAKHTKDFHIPFFVEYGFTLEVDGVPVTGKVDRVDKLADGTIAIVDYKTGKAIAKDRVQQDAQLTMYQMACEELLGLKVSSLTFYHVPSLTELTVQPHDGGQIGALRKRIVGVAKSIEADSFAPKPEERKCSWCDFKPHCPEFRHMYVTHNEAATPPEALDAEIAALVDRLGEARERQRELKAAAEDLEREIAADMRRKGYLRAFGDRYDAELVADESWEFTDKEAFKLLLRSYRLYERVLIPSALQVKKLLKSDDLPAGFLEEVSKLGKKTDVTTVQVKRTNQA